MPLQHQHLASCHDPDPCAHPGSPPPPQIAEKHTAWGSALSAPLVSMLAAVGLAASGVIPVDCAAYGVRAGG